MIITIILFYFAWSESRTLQCFWLGRMTKPSHVGHPAELFIYIGNALNETTSMFSYNSNIISGGHFLFSHWSWVWARRNHFRVLEYSHEVISREKERGGGEYFNKEETMEMIFFLWKKNRVNRTEVFDIFSLSHFPSAPLGSDYQEIHSQTWGFSAEFRMKFFAELLIVILSVKDDKRVSPGIGYRYRLPSSINANATHSKQKENINW